MFNSARIALICTLFTAAVSLRADSSCIASSLHGISDCGDETSRLARISGIEDVELNFFGLGAGDFQAFFKASSYAALGSESEKPILTPKSSSGDSGSQDSGGGFPGGDCCGSFQPPSWAESFDSAPTGTPLDTLLGKILAPGGGAADLSIPDPAPDPTPEPVYSVLLVLGAGLLFYAGRKGRSVNSAVIS